MILISFSLGGLFATLLWLGIWRRSALDLAHEVRRPMTALLLAAEGLREHLREHELTALTSQVQKASHLLDHADWISHVLDMWGNRRSKVRSDVTVPLEQVLLAWAPAARALGREIQIRPEVTQSRVTASEHVAQSFSSLVANALEHGTGDVVVSRKEALDGSLGIDVANAIGGGSSWLPGHRYRGRGLRVAGKAARRGGARLVPWSAESGSAHLRLP